MNFSNGNFNLKRCSFDEEDLKKKIDGCSLLSSIPPFLLIPPHDHSHMQDEDEDGESHVEIWRHIKNGPSPYFLQRQLYLMRKRRLIPQTRSLYNLVTQKVCDFDVQLSHNYHCRGSSFGWLVTFKPKKKFGYFYKYYVRLYNPFLSDNHNVITLPPFYKILKLHNQATGFCMMEDIFYRPFFYLRKAVLSCNPMFARNNFVVMAIVSEDWKLAFYTPEIKDWTPINWERDDWSQFEDVIYINRTQQFYAALPTGAVLAIDLVKEEGEGGGGPQAQIVPKVTQVTPPTHDFVGLGFRYLVETSPGELLQLYKHSGSCDHEIDDTFVPVKFEVFKLDPILVTWSRIHDMGDNILFVGDNSSISRSASDFPGCKPNCIYYTDDVSMNPQVGTRYGAQDMGIYNLADGTHQPHYPTASRRNFPAPIWLEPTL